MLFVVFGVIFLVTAVLTAAEMATFSARPDRMRQVAESGDERGKLVLVYQRSPVSFLAAGQVIATAAALMIGAIMQSEVVPPIAQALADKLPITLEQALPYASTFALIVFTVLALILTNVVPKQIGFDHADAVAVFFARPFRFLIRITRPFAWLVTIASRAVEFAVNRRVRQSARVTEADVLTLIAEGIRLGALDEREAKFVKNALALSDRSVGAVMTPLASIEYVDARLSRQETDRVVRASRHSYLPVGDGSLDRPLGVLRVRDWLTSEQDLRSMLFPLGEINAKASAAALFDVLRDLDTRMVVVRESGATVGIVTVNDAVSLLASDVRSLHD